MQRNRQTIRHSLLIPHARLPDCQWRRVNGGIECLHPQMHATAGYIDEEICCLCRLNDARQRDATPSVRSWAVGVTTAPRPAETLTQTLESLARAGWSKQCVFAEPESRLPANATQVVQRVERLGAFPNWYLGLAELVLRQPEADAYMMLQDDVELARNLRSYLEQTLWPGHATGVVSVYCPSHYRRRRSVGYHAIDEGWNTWGALCYVLPRRSARWLLSDPEVLEHRWRGPGDGLKNVDSVVGAWCRRAQLNYLIHVPSLVQHTGDASTLYPAARATGRRQADDFLGDAAQIMTGIPPCPPADEFQS